MRKLRVAIFMPRANSFYLSLMFGLKRGFEQNNAEVFASAGLYDQPCLLEFCRQFEPDLIFEMNRARCELPDLPPHIKHIAWIVDLLGQSVDHYCGSDITYYFSDMWRRTVTANCGLTDSLQPGSCEITYNFQPRQAISDFTFAGHIPKPWTSEELSREIFHHQGQPITFGKFHDDILEYWKRTNFLEDKTHIDSIYQYIEEHYGNKISINDQWLRYDIATRSIRLRNRHNLLSMILKTSASLRIYGSENWRDWPQYRPYYHYFIDQTDELRQVYQSTKINLQEGISPHFRVFDCMSSGGLMFIKRTPEDNFKGGIKDYFEPFVHYVPFSEDDFAELAKEYLTDDTKRNKIINAAARRIAEKHTWQHRAKKIINDYHCI